MYSYIKGIAVKKNENTLVIENNGIGYEIIVSNHTLDSIISIPSEIKIFTHYHVREDQAMLIGFISSDEKSVFNKLIKVNGVGVKMAITILSGINYKDLTLSIYNSDISMLSKIKGVGKKTCERIILELKGSIEDLNLDVSSDENTSFDTSTRSESIDALIALGVNYVDANRLVKKVAKEDDTVEIIIEKALKSFRS